MIIPERPHSAADVQLHYDELDIPYRTVWGEHVHHGYWRTGRESPAEAAEALVRLVAERLAPEPGQKLCDIGCGYGATAGWLAERCGAEVTGFTLSEAQAAVGRTRPGFTCLVRDWLDNGLPDASFDGAYAIESSEHMVDKARFFAEANRVLKPGGRFVVCAWLEGEGATPWQAKHLLEPICREGRLAGIGTESEYRVLLEEAGLAVDAGEDLSRRVARTWPVCIRRLAAGLVREPTYRRFLLDARHADRIFAVTLVRLWLAYRTGAMRYVLFVARKAA